MLSEAQAEDIVGERVSFKAVPNGTLVGERVLPLYKSEGREEELCDIVGAMSTSAV